MMKPVNFNSQSATNLSLDLTNNTLTGTKAQFDTALSNDNFAYIGQANVFTQNQEVEKTGAVPTITIDRPEVLADATQLSAIDITGFSSTSVARTYANIRAIMEDDTNTTEDGSMRLYVMQGGTLTSYIQLNDAIGLDIDMLKPVNFNAQALSGVLSITMSTDTSHIIDDTASILRFKVPTADTFAWQINAADVATLSASAFNVASGIKIQENGVNISPIGLHDVYRGADAMAPTITAGCQAIEKNETATNKNNYNALNFDQTTEENAFFTTSYPRNYNNGTVKATIYWTAGTGTGGVAWGIKGVARSDGDALDVAWGTEVVTTDTLLATGQVHVTVQSAAITIAGTPADKDFILWNVARKVADGGDTLTGDAKLLGISIEFTLDAAVAA